LLILSSTPHTGIPVILDYCAEGDIHSPDLESKLDENASLFAASAEQISHQNHEMISIKLTGLLDMRVLKRWNEAV
jgi:DNA repair exonuclease SbcCD nuclease subunit